MAFQEILPAFPLEMSIQIFTEQARHAVVSRRMFAELFEDSPMQQERDRSMYEMAPHFHDWLNNALLEYVLLQAGKLLDPPWTDRGGQSRWNVSCKAIQERVMDLSLKGRLEAVGLQSFKDHIETARNRLLAHADEEAIAAGEPLGGFPSEVGDRFYAGLQEYVDLLHGEIHPLQDSMIVNDVQNLLYSVINSWTVRFRERDQETMQVLGGRLNKRNGETEET